MIRRSLGELYESIREFFVAVDDDGRVVGCAALHVFWEDLAELKCLAVAESMHGRGVGRHARRCLLGRRAGDGPGHGLHPDLRPRVLRALRLPPIDKAELPHKIWNECVRCPLFPNCNETALIRTAEPAESDVLEAFAAAGSAR